MTDQPFNSEESPPSSCGARLLILELPGAADEVVAGLRPAERDVATGVMSGLSNAEIAERRRTSTRTVANQMAALFERLEVQSRTELVRRLYGGEVAA